MAKYFATFYPNIPGNLDWNSIPTGEEVASKMECSHSLPNKFGRNSSLIELANYPSAVEMKHASPCRAYKRK